jgi:hypothetical protein
MKRLLRSIVALTAGINSALHLRSPADGQPRAAANALRQLSARLAEIADRQGQIRNDATGTEDLIPVMDRFEGVLKDADALLQRMDECSRSPVPSMAD